MAISDRIFMFAANNDLHNLNLELNKNYADPFDGLCEIFKIAYENNNFKMVERLMKERKQYDSFIPETVLSLAIENKDNETTNLIFNEYRESINFDYGNAEIFVSACKNNNVFLTKLLLDQSNQMDLNQFGKKGLEEAILKVNKDIVNLLLNEKDIINRINIK